MRSWILGAAVFGSLACPVWADEDCARATFSAEAGQLYLQAERAVFDSEAYEAALSAADELYAMPLSSCERRAVMRLDTYASHEAEDYDRMVSVARQLVSHPTTDEEAAANLNALIVTGYRKLGRGAEADAYALAVGADIR